MIASVGDGKVDDVATKQELPKFVEHGHALH
jgi:hypothetical protein